MSYLQPIPEIREDDTVENLRRRSKWENATTYAEGTFLTDDATAWWIDSGATTHVCKDRFWFKTFVPVEDGSVLYMGDDHFAPVEGKGNVVLEFSSGKTITLFNVLYVPKLRKNLISGPDLDIIIMVFDDEFDGVPNDSGSVFMSSSNIINSSLWHAR
ncbi:hypothetical protein KIW84_UN0906 [Lathyrus oleraceus]|nr:hypothetical protein KIW84_UN0906 [Pisum sativum]